MDGASNSGYGIASLILSIIAGMLMLLLFIVAGVIEVSTPEDTSTDAVVGLAAIAFLFLSLIAFVLGLVGLMQRDRQKLLAILGCTFSAMTILGTLALMLIGLAMQ